MPKITLLLHNIRSTHNVGAIFRTAEGFGVQQIILSGYTPYPKTTNDPRLPHIADKLTSQIHKTALGAENMVPFTYYESLDEWLSLFGIENILRHNAVSDAYATAKLLLIAQARAVTQGKDSAAVFMDIERARRWVRRGT